MINEKMLELICLDMLLMDEIVEGSTLTAEEFNVLRDRYQQLRKEFISEYVKVSTQK